MTMAAVTALCSQIPWCEPTVLESALELALEIAREGREGRPNWNVVHPWQASRGARGVPRAHPRPVGRPCSSTDTHHRSRSARNDEGS